MEILLYFFLSRATSCYKEHFVAFGFIATQVLLNDKPSAVATTLKINYMQGKTVKVDLVLALKASNFTGEATSYCVKQAAPTQLNLLLHSTLL